MNAHGRIYPCIAALASVPQNRYENVWPGKGGVRIRRKSQGCFAGVKIMLLTDNRQLLRFYRSSIAGTVRVPRAAAKRVTIATAAQTPDMMRKDAAEPAIATIGW
jgi:hypothetical protein